MFGKDRRCLTPVLVLFFAAAAFAQSGKYAQLQPEILQSRLKQYSDQNSKREAVVKKLFEEAGCSEDRLWEQAVPEAAAPNVICTLPGASKKVILVGAHFDHVEKGDGVVDNWSGASLLPSLFQSLSAISRKHTFVFISFTDEEKGMVGSTFYSKKLLQEEIGRIHAMVDIDTLGLGPTKVWVSNSDPKLVSRLFRVAATMKLPVQEMNVDQMGDSDGRPFKRLNIPIITLHSVTRETVQILHTNRDNISAMKLDDYYNSYKLIAGYLAALDSSLAVR
jgi:Iap family predicted aminopeptidase